jgi:hypothetical protein
LQQIFKEAAISLNISAARSSASAETSTHTNGFILYTAPTGKAAAVIRKRAGKKAFTMHQVSGVTIFKKIAEKIGQKMALLTQTKGNF